MILRRLRTLSVRIASANPIYLPCDFVWTEEPPRDDRIVDLIAGVRSHMVVRASIARWIAPTVPGRCADATMHVP